MNCLSCTVAQSPKLFSLKNLVSIATEKSIAKIVERKLKEAILYGTDGDLKAANFFVYYVPNYQQPTRLTWALVCYHKSSFNPVDKCSHVSDNGDNGYPLFLLLRIHRQSIRKTKKNDQSRKILMLSINWENSTTKGCWKKCKRANTPALTPRWMNGRETLFCDGLSELALVIWKVWCVIW